MSESLYALALLACPIGMGVMMWMMRGNQHRSTRAEDSDQQAELARLRGEINELRALRDHGSVESRGDRPTIGHSSL